MERLCVLLLALSGCLSNPTPHPETESTAADTSMTGKQDAVEGSDSTNLADDSVDNTNDTALEEVEVIEPEPVMAVRDLVVEDLDRDGYQDVILTNWIGHEDKWGIEIFKGSNGTLGFSAPDKVYHTFPRPDGVARMNLRDVDDPDEEYELVVLGQANTGRGYVQIIEVADETIVGSYKRETTNFPLVPDGGANTNLKPMYIAPLRWKENGPLKLLLGDFDGLFTFEPVGGWNQNGLTNGVSSRIGHLDELEYLRGVVRVESAPNDYLAVWRGDNEIVYLPYEQEGAEQFQAYPGGDFDQVWSAKLDDDDDPEFIALKDGQLAVVKLAPFTSPGIATSYKYPGGFPLFDGVFEDVQVADIDRSGKPDIVLFDNPGPESTQACTVRLFRDPLFKSPTQTIPYDHVTSVNTVDVPYAFAEGFEVLQIAAGKFNNRGGEIWGFDISGKAQCIGWDPVHDHLGACGL